ncbi:MAG: hypothetical protein NT065_01280 [Chlamydiae bacterium]|nr:hypothetical protein [Chlamydiota bacterium]
MNLQEYILDILEKNKDSSEQERVFTQKEVETIYIAAYQFYQIGEYTKSCELFLQLTKSFPLQSSGWKGLASAYQMQGLWDPSLTAWAFCSLLEAKDPACHYHAAECLHAKKEYEEAKKALAKARMLSMSEEHTALLQKINLLEEFCTPIQI